MSLSDILTFVRDGTWQFVGALLALLAVYFASKQTKRKRLQYEVQASSELLTQNEELTGKVQVLFDGKEVSNIDLWVVRIANTGNVEILVSDFVTPVCLSFPETATVLSAVAVRSDPKNLNAIVNAAANIVELKPLLLNPKDGITIKVLLANATQKNLSVDARIVGLQSITRLPQGQILPKSVKIAFLVGVAGLAALFASSGFSEHSAVNKIVPISVFAVLYSLFELLRWMLSDVYAATVTKIRGDTEKKS